jgi:nucleotide-binding universal stress UspA family protein
MQLERILVATDFSDAATKAFEQSAALAAGGEATIHVLHHLASPVPVFPPVAHLGAGSWAELGPLLDDYTSELRTEATRKLEELVSRAPAGVTVETSIEETLDPVEAIAQKVEAWHPDLLAVGTQGRHGIEKLVMGSVATKLLHRADTAMMLVRSDSELYFGEQPLGPILVPVDFSDHSHRALAFARALASRHRGSLRLLHSVDLLHTPLTPGGLTSRFDTEPGLRDDYVTALNDMLGDSPGEVAAVDGSPAGAILAWREKWGARLVVMGSRGLAGLPHLLLGSVAETVARYCEVPVIIIK